MFSLGAPKCWFIFASVSCSFISFEKSIWVFFSVCPLSVQLFLRNAVNASNYPITLSPCIIDS